jgi:type IV pilus assembly protein PilN
MVVEINLLPKKERTFKRTILVFGITLLLLIGCAGFVLIDYIRVKSDIQAVKAQTEEIADNRLLLESDKDGAAYRAIENLQTTVGWVKQNEFSTVYLLAHIVELLPERGYFIEYTQTADNTIQITAQFDTIREVSAYLHELTNSPYIKEVSLSTVDTTPIIEEESTNTSILPRYQGAYQLLVDREALVKLNGEEKNG